MLHSGSEESVQAESASEGECNAGMEIEAGEEMRITSRQQLTTATL